MYFSLAVSILAVQCVVIGEWLIDDSAISLAYARNLAWHGEIVSQFGAAPVEGFSNPLWTAILALTQLVTSSTLVLKALPASMLIWVCWRMTVGFAEDPQQAVVARVALLFLVLQPSIAIWGFSGLENPLYLAAGVELLIRMCRIASPTASKLDALFAGVAASCLVLTRPEGILYSPLFCLAYLQGDRNRITIRDVISYSFFPPIFAYLAYTLFRFYYFGEFLPNTHLAKGGPTFSHLIYLLLLQPDVILPACDVFAATFGEFLQMWGAVVSAGLIFWTWRNRPSGLLTSAALLSSMAMIAFLLLPGDWMGEVRFATLFFPGFYLAMSYCLRHAVPHRLYKPSIGILLLLSAVMNIDRILEFRSQPPISISEVQERGEHFSRWGSQLNIARPSLLTADIGGLLLLDRIEVVDLGMLTDKTIAETLGEGSGMRSASAFRDYILDERKPTFIELRAYHSWIARFDEDPRFLSDYVAIKEYKDGWVLKRYAETVTSGDFVRRSAVEHMPQVLSQMRTEAEQFHYPFSETDENLNSPLN